MYVSRKLTFILALCLSLFLSSSLFASTTKLGYSGRLVLTNGTPVTGTPDLKFDLYYSGSTGVNRGTQTINAVPLSNGIYTVELDFAGIATVIDGIPTNETLVIQVTDITDAMNPVVYDFQNILATPIAVYANHAALAETIANDAITPDSVNFTGSCSTGQVVSVNASNEFECVNQTAAVSVDSTLVNNAGVIGLPIVVTGNTYYSVTVDDYGRVTGGSTTPPSTTANDIQDNLIVDADINTNAAIAWSKINKTGATPSDVGLTVNSAGPLGTTSAVATENVIKTYVDTTATAIADAKVINDMSGVQTTIAPSVDSVKNYVTAQTGAITSSQWTDSGLDIYFNTGHVGIGTNSPTGPLHIVGGANDVNTMRFGATDADVAAITDYANMAGLLIASEGVSNSYHSFRVVSDIDGADIESLAVTNAGRVGVGVLNPTEKLEVAGNVKGTGLCIGADCRTSWPTGNAGTVTSVTGGAGLTGGTITSSGTLAVDVGTTNGKIAQVGVGDKLADSIINYNPALDVALTGYTTGAASSVVATDTILQAFGKIQGQLDAHATSIAAAVTSVTGGTGLTGGTITSSGTLAVDVGTTNGKIAQVGAGDKLADSIINYNPAIDVALTGYATGAASSVVATDTVLEAFGKIQAQINSQATSIASNSNLVINSMAGTETAQAPSVDSVKNYVDARASQWTTSASDIYYATGMVGIGTTSPRTKLHLTDTLTNNANIDESGFYSHVLHSINTSGPYSSRGAYVINATQVDSGVTSSGMQVGQLTQALRNAGANGDSGTVAVQTASNVAYGHYNYDGTASPITTDAYGIKVTNYNRSGTVANAYDLHIGNDSGAGGTVTNRFGLYQVGASYKNYFQGSVGIGTNSPTTELEVSGIVSANNIGLSLPASNSLDSNALPAGLYRANTSTTGSPTPGESGATLNMQSGVASGAVAQLHIKANNTEDPRAFIRHSDNTGDFKDWQEIVTADATGNVGIGTTATQKLTVDGNINVTATNDICIDGTGCLAAAISGAGEVNTASSAGGTSIYKTKTGADLVFKGLTSSSDITLTANTNDVGLAINTANGANELLRLDASGRVPASNIMGTPLTGYTVGTNSVLAPTDSIVDAYGKLQAQLNAQFTSITGLDTDDVAEAGNLYFTDARAQSAAVVNSTAGSETTQAPSVSAIKNYVDARATQWSTSGSDIYYNTGKVGIGTTNPSQKLSVSGGMLRVDTGTTGESLILTGIGSNLQVDHDGTSSVGIRNSGGGGINFKDSTNAKVNVHLTNNGKIGIGTNAPLGQIHTFGTEPVFFDRVSGNPSHLLLRGAKGSIGAEVAPSDNEEVGRISFTGYDGSSWATTALAGISGRASENWSPTTRGTNLDFKTVTNGSLSEQTRMIIANDGKVGIGSSEPISKLTVRGADDAINGPTLTLAGDVSNQFEAGRIRFAEPNNTFQGGYIHYDGTGPDYLHIGVHETADLLTSSDTNAISISRQTANVGVGTSTPSSRLHVYENGKHYHVNRKIDGYSQTENSTGINYILLHRAYDGALLDEHYVNGEINIRRGGTAAWNRKVSAQVNTACAYDSCRGNIINYGEYTYLAYVTFGGVKYMALAIPDNSTMYNATFTGYAYNATGVEQLRLVYDTDVTNVTTFSQNAIHTNAINVAAGNISTASDYALGYNLTSTTDKYAIYPHLLGQKSKTGLGPSLPYDNAMSIESDALITFVETDADKVSGYMDVNTNTFVWDGNVGIGMTAPTNALHVTGNIGATGWVGAGCEGSCSSDAYAINYADGRIRTYSGTGSACEKAGGSATFTCSSDRRLKHDIEDFKDGIDVIMKLRPRTYVWNADESEKINYGFIAQEVQEAIPHAVTVDKHREDGEYLTLNQGEFTPYIINALQDLNHMIEDNKKMFNFMSSGIETKVDENSREIASLKEENAEIKAENKMLKDYLCSKDPEAPFCGQ